MSPFRSFAGSVLATASIAALLTGCRADLVTRNVRDVPFLTTSRALKAEITNVGKASAGQTRTAVYTRPAVAQPYVERARTSTPPLAANQTEDLVLWVIPAAESPGPSFCLQVKVCADADEAVVESSEANNCTERALGSGPPCP